MRLGDRIPETARTIGRESSITLFWSAFFAFCGALVVFMLLQRLGLPAEIVMGAIIAMTICLFFWLSWISRTMTSGLFFYANRALGPFTSGLGSTTDLMSGTLLIVLFSSGLAGKMVLATGLLLGVLFQATLFSQAFQRSGVSTLPGFFAWRCRSQLTGYLALAAVIGLLLQLALAEFRIAENMLRLLTGVSSQQTAWIVLILAVLPSVFGGWSGLLLVNATLVVWMLICTLVPAAATGFFDGLLQSSLQSDFVGAPLDPLLLVPTTLFPGAGSSAPLILIGIITLAAGFSVLPHSLSRLATNGRAIEAIESVGWLALTLFLMLSALPLSVGLIMATPTSSKLAVLLQTQPVIQMLPYFVILFAALNGLAATLFAASSSIVRAASRLRNLDPGEQSVFSTRFGVVLLAVAMIVWPPLYTPAPEQLLIGALMLGAGGLFVPLIAAAWVTAFSTWALGLSIVAGTAVTGMLMTPTGLALIQHPILSGALGALAATLVLVGDRLIALILKRPLAINSSARFLRHH